MRQVALWRMRIPPRRSSAVCEGTSSVGEHWRRSEPVEGGYTSDDRLDQKILEARREILQAAKKRQLTVSEHQRRDELKHCLTALDAQKDIDGMLLPIWDIQWMLQSKKEVKDDRRVGDAPHWRSNIAAALRSIRGDLNYILLQEATQMHLDLAYWNHLGVRDTPSWTRPFAAAARHADSIRDRDRDPIWSGLDQDRSLF